MQYLMGCPKGQRLPPRKLFKDFIPKSYGKKQTCNLKRVDVDIYKSIKNTFTPISNHVLKIMSVNSEKVEFVLQQILCNHRCSGSFFQRNRYFSTTSAINTKNFSNQSPNRPNEKTKNNAKSNSSGSSNENSDNDSKRDSDKGTMPSRQTLLFLVLSYIVLSYVLSTGQESGELPQYVSWNEFVYQMLAKGEVSRVVIAVSSNLAIIEVHPGAVINGKQQNKLKYYMSIPNSDEFEQKLRKVEIELGIKYEEYVPVEYIRHLDGTGASLTRIAITLVLLYVLWNVGKKFSDINQINPFTKLQRARFTLVEPHSSRNGVRFTDVAGLHEAKTELMEFVDYLTNPSRYKALGAKVPKGALLLGPPGCGKTLLAKAIATEASVPFLSVNGTEFIELVGGLGPARVRDLFKEAKKRAPTIIYIDEIDSIGKNRSQMNSWSTDQEGERTLNQLLVEMDGMSSSDDIIVLASTNRHDVLDRALLRPGRFDRKILIDFPTLEERKQIFETHLKTLVLDSAPSKYSTYLAHLTPRFSGADIANVCNEAALYAARFQKKTVEGSDLMYAIDKIVGGTEKKSSVMSPTEKRVVAYRQAGQALLSWILEHTRGPVKVSIVTRTDQRTGYVAHFNEQNHLYSREFINDNLTEMLGARAAEQIIFNQTSVDSHMKDIQNATEIAYKQVKHWGMSPTVGLVSFPKIDPKYEKKPYSQQLANLMDMEARTIVAKAYQRAVELLTENQGKLVILAEALLEKETLEYKDIEKLIGPPPFKAKRERTIDVMNALTESMLEKEKNDEKMMPTDDGPEPSQSSA